MPKKTEGKVRVIQGTRLQPSTSSMVAIREDESQQLSSQADHGSDSEDGLLEIPFTIPHATGMTLNN